MKVEVIEPHGFCSGVRGALARAEEALSRGGRVFCLHALVHNEHVVASLREKGMEFVDDLASVPDGGCVLFSAHGVSPEVRWEARRRGLDVMDATCPFVARVHRQVAVFAGQGCPVVVVGDAGHAEVEGVVGAARAAGAEVAVVRGGAEVASIPFSETALIGVVCQTTLSADVKDEVLGALRARYPRLETTAASDVCTATRDRQNAVRAFVARGGDGMLVLGSASSSNTRRLAELARAAGVRTWCAADLDEVAACDFAGVSVLGVTSGASTPEDFFAAAMRVVVY